MVSIFFKPFLKIREHLIKGWHFSFLPLLVLVIHFTWEVGCVFLIPSNSAARRLALRAHSRHHGNQRIAVMRSHALCVATQCYCSPVTVWERHVNIPIKEDWSSFHWSSCAPCMDIMQHHLKMCFTPMQGLREWLVCTMKPMFSTKQTLLLRNIAGNLNWGCHSEASVWPY